MQSNGLRHNNVFITLYCDSTLSQDTQTGKSDETFFDQDVCDDIGHIEIGLVRNGSDYGEIDESDEARNDPRALTNLATPKKLTGT